MEDRGVSAAPPAGAGTQTGTQPTPRSIFDADGKLSSASAATSLKHAKPQDLPSFPSAGLQMSSAGAAASLASSNRKSFEHWKPEAIPAANKAALLASDYAMEPLWQPQASAAGSKAAMMAHSNTAKKNHAAQEIEAQAKRTSTTKTAALAPAAQAVPAETQAKALMAATASHNRRRSGSLPSEPTAQSVQSSQWALKAATKSHKAGFQPISRPFASGDPGFEAARIQNMAKNNVDRQLYTSSPPVAIEVQEKNRQDTLRASAVAMAQTMYAIQQRHINEAASKPDGQALAASRARSHTLTSSSGSAGGDRATSTAGYENLEEAARKLAQERLAKIHDEHAEYRSYYGQTSPNRSRLSMRMRRRASSAADADDSDEESSRRIKSQMSIFQSKLAEVDTKKRRQDRDNLLEIAHRNVDAQIRKMDNKVFQDTGKASPAQMEEWEKAAREKAQKDSDERMRHAGKVHIGGGKYFDQSELDAIARARLQPTLDEISEKAEKQRARDEEARLERERKQAEAERDKVRQAETAAALKQLKAQEKQEERSKKEEEKRALKEQQNAEKDRKKAEAAAEKERARLAKEEKQKSKESKPERLSTVSGHVGGAAVGTGAAGATAGVRTSTEEAVATTTGPATSEAADEGQTFHDQVTSPTPAAAATTTIRQEPSATTPPPPSSTQILPTTTSEGGGKSIENKNSLEEANDIGSSPTKSSSRVKSWMKVRFRSKSNAQKGSDSMPALPETTTEATPTTRESDEAGPRANSMRDVAMAGRTTTTETTDMYGGDRELSPDRQGANVNAVRQSSSISSLSSEYSAPETTLAASTEHHDSETGNRGRQSSQPRVLKEVKPDENQAKDEKAVEPTVTNTSEDEFEEARDTFGEEKLAPPPPLSSVTGEGSGMKTISPKGSRDRSRFTEDL